MVTAQVHIKALLQGAQPLSTQVPLTNVGRGAARGLGAFSQRLLGQRQCLHPVGRGRSFALGASWPAIQSVILSRAGYLPVNSAARVGEHTVHAE